jgi:hypothetical protein
MRTSGVYTIEDDMETYTLDFHYEWEYERETRHEPEYNEIHIHKVELNQMDITQFYWDYMADNDRIIEQIYEHLKESSK